MKKSIIFGLIAIFLLLVGCSTTGNIVVDYDDFAKYLTEEGIVLVGAEWCGHCQDQKEMFGESFQYVTFVDAVVDPELAASYGVPGYPTWVLADGTQIVGVQSLDNLMEKTGYI